MLGGVGISLTQSILSSLTVRVGSLTTWLQGAISGSQMSNYKPFAFVLMPFQSEFRDVYLYGIKQTCDDLGVVAERVDEQHFSETILERVYRQIENSDFVIAEMTGMNPNVFYEVGYAHAKNKQCALITQNASDIPFDLKHHPHVVYDGTIEDLKAQLHPRVDWLKTETQKKKSETISLAVSTENELLEKGEYFHEGTFDLIIKMRNPTDQKSPEIEAIHVLTTSEWTASDGGTACEFDLSGKPRLKKNLVVPKLKRIAPKAFAQERVRLKKQFWSKWDGVEEKDSYTAKGKLPIEIVTSEGTLNYDFSMEVELDEIPF